MCASSTGSAGSCWRGPGQGAGPGAGPLTIDLDSTSCETYGLKKQGARHHAYTHVRGYHPLLAVAAGTGEVLMARLRGGRSNTMRGAAGFLTETIGRVRAAGATGPLHPPRARTAPLDPHRVLTATSARSGPRAAPCPAMGR